MNKLMQILFVFFLSMAFVLGHFERSYSNQSTTPLQWNYETGNSISCIAISDDGLHIAMGTEGAGEQGIYLFEKDSNTPLWKYSVTGYVTSVALSANGGSLVASVSSYPTSKIYLFDTSSNIPLWSFSYEFGLGSTSISADGNSIVFAECGGTVGETRKMYLFNRSSSTPVWIANIAAGGGASLSISDDGSRIVVGGTQLYMFNRSSNIPLWTFQPSGAVANVSISSDGSYLATGTVGINPSVYMFSSSSNTPIWNYPTSAIVSITSDGLYVAGASRSYSGGPKGFVLWHKDSSMPQWISATQEDPANTSISSSGNQIAGIAGGDVYLFNKGSSLPVWIYPGTYEKSVISDEGRYIVAYEKNKLSLFDATFTLLTDAWVDDDYCQECNNDGHTWGYDAFDTIQAAVDVLWMGGTVHVAAGTYTEAAFYRGGGYENTGVFINRDNVRLVGAGRQTTLIDSDQDANRVLITGKGCEVQGFTIQNSGWGYRGIYLYSAGGNNVIRGNTIINNGTGVELNGSGGSIVENNIIKNNDFGISNQDAHGNTFSKNIIVSNGVGITSHSDFTVVKNCLIARNGSGIRAEYTSGDELINNTIVENDVGIYMFTGDASITNTIVWGNNHAMNLTSGNYSVSFCSIEGGWPGETNISLHPAFIDAANFNYRLENYSPCIGLGTRDGAPTSDIINNKRPNPSDSNPDIGAYENSLAIPDIPPMSLLNTFGLALGNMWTYSGVKNGNPYTVQREITSIDPSRFPVSTYVMKIKENGTLKGTEWYEDRGNQINLWGGTYEEDGASYTVNFSSGLKGAWYPLVVGEHSYSTTTTEILGYLFNVSLTVDVLKRESIALSFDTLDAFEVQYQIRIWGKVGQQLLEVTDNFTWWMVPYLGVLKERRAISDVQLTSFAIGGGLISQVSDSDKDELSDYKEIFVYNTHWQYADTDGDGVSDGWEIDHNLDPKSVDSDKDEMPDGWEVEYGLDPLANDADKDLDDDGISNLDEFIQGTDPSDQNDPRPQGLPWLFLLLE